MPRPTLIVIGSSAGGVEALITLVSTLPNTFSTPICIAHHLSHLGPSRLSAILTHRGKLPASYPADGAQLLAGAIFIAPPSHNLSVIGEHVVVKQALLQRPCPSVDLLFASAASSYQSRLIGVILTGMLTDGTVGLQAVKRYGGTSIIQDPVEATFPSMPQSAQDNCTIDLLPSACPDRSALAGVDWWTNHRRGCGLTTRRSARSSPPMPCCNFFLSAAVLRLEITCYTLSASYAALVHPYNKHSRPAYPRHGPLTALHSTSVTTSHSSVFFGAIYLVRVLETRMPLATCRK